MLQLEAVPLDRWAALAVRMVGGGVVMASLAVFAGAATQHPSSRAWLGLGRAGYYCHRPTVGTLKTVPRVLFNARPRVRATRVTKGLLTAAGRMTRLHSKGDSQRRAIGDNYQYPAQNDTLCTPWCLD